MNEKTICTNFVVNWSFDEFHTPSQLSHASSFELDCLPLGSLSEGYRHVGPRILGFPQLLRMARYIDRWRTLGTNFNSFY